MPNIYVLSKTGKPLMPVHSYARARRLIQNGKARVAAKVPFTIQLTYEIQDLIVEECFIGIDPGRTNIGVCVIDSRGNVLLASDVVTRNKDIPKHMQERKAHRQAARRGVRLKKQRRAVKASPDARITEYWRMLPGCAEPVCCKVFRNAEARFIQRERPEGWLTPTARHLLLTHINVVRKIQKLLPVSGIIMEINRFDFARMENPGIRNWEYQKGKLFGFRDVYEAVACRQEGKCLLCNSPIEHYHHLLPKHSGGSDSIDNLAGLCISCHQKVHTDPKVKTKLSEKAMGIMKKYHALSVINQITEKLLQEYASMLPAYVTTGYETKCMRELYHLEKDHYIDAWCIAVSAIQREPGQPDFKDSVHPMKQFRRHNRARIKAQTERTYRLDGNIIARNRKPRFEQNGPALSDLILTKQEISRLQVTKSTRRYHTKGRLMPGTVFEYQGKRHVLSGQLTGGAYYRALGDPKTNYPAKMSRILLHNTGLVFTE